MAIATAVRRDIEAWQNRGGRLDIDALRAGAVFIGDVVTVDLGDGGANVLVRLVDLADSGGLLVADVDGGPTREIAPLQIVAARSQPPWHAPPRLPR